MNVFKAAFCRAFQQGFRLMYPFFPYREPEALHSDEEIPPTLATLNISSALLVTNETLRSLGVTAALEQAMNRSMGIPDRLSDIRAGDIDRLSRLAAREGNPLYPVPRLMDRRELQRFYAMVAQGQDIA